MSKNLLSQLQTLCKRRTGPFKRSYAAIDGLVKLSRSLPESVTKMLVETLVIPHLTYCMLPSGQVTGKVKKAFAKSVEPLRSNCEGRSSICSCDPVQREFEWLGTNDLIAERHVGLLHCLITNQHSFARERGTPGERSERNTRATETIQLQLPWVRTEHVRRYFNLLYGVSLWNEAPATVTDTTSSECKLSDMIDIYSQSMATQIKFLIPDVSTAGCLRQWLN